MTVFFKERFTIRIYFSNKSVVYFIIICVVSNLLFIKTLKYTSYIIYLHYLSVIICLSFVCHLFVYHLSIYHLSVYHLSVYHLSVYYLSVYHLFVYYMSVNYQSAYYLSVYLLVPPTSLKVTYSGLAFSQVNKLSEHFFFKHFE